MRLCVGIVLVLLVLPACGQQVTPAQAQPACSNVRINQQGTTGQPITVDTRTGGVPIVERNTSRCSFTIINETANPMRCAPTTGVYPLTVTATVGVLIPVGVYPVFGAAGQQQWNCIQTAGAAAVVSITEDMP